jgi:hypothetical protein
MLTAEPVSPLSDEAQAGAVRHDGLVVGAIFALSITCIQLAGA